MKLNELIQKIIAGEEITQEDRDALQNVTIPDEDQIAAKIIGRERSKYEKQINEIKSQLEDYKTKAESLQSKGEETDSEKINAKIELLMNKLNEKDELIKQKDTEIYNTKKTQIIGSLKSGLNLIKDYDQDYVDYKLEKYTKDYELDDIPNFKDDIIKSFVKDHPSLIKADEKSGTGLPPNKSRPASKFNLNSIEDMSADDIVANLDNIMGALKEGK